MRVNRTRGPLAEMTKFSLTSAPLKIRVSLTVLALDRVAAVARVPPKHIVAGAHASDVGASVAVDEIDAVAAEQHVVAVAADDGVVAGPAVHR